MAASRWALDKSCATAGQASATATVTPQTTLRNAFMTPLATQTRSPDKARMDEASIGGLRLFERFAFLQPVIFQGSDLVLELGFLNPKLNRLVRITGVNRWILELFFHLGEIFALPLKLLFERLDVLAQGRQFGTSSRGFLALALAVGGGSGGAIVSVGPGISKDRALVSVQFILV